MYVESLALYNAVIESEARDDVDVRLRAAYASRSFREGATVHIPVSVSTLSSIHHAPPRNYPSCDGSQLFRSTRWSPSQLQSLLPTAAAGRCGGIPSSSSVHDASSPCGLAGTSSWTLDGAGGCGLSCSHGDSYHSNHRSGEAGGGVVAPDHTLQGLTEGGVEEESCGAWDWRG